MNIRVLSAIVLVSMLAAEIQARSPFGRVRKARRTVQRNVQARPSAPRPMEPGLLQNSKEMTRRYGPSILMRQESADMDASKFVNQPN